MAVIFLEGFDWYQTSDLSKRWTSVGASQAVGASVARQPSGQGLSNGNTTVSGVFSQYRSLGTNYTQGVIGFAAFSSNAPAGRTLVTVLDGTTEQISVRANGSSVLTVTRNGTVLATGTTVLSSGVWYYVELKFTINASTGVVELKLNGASEIASTGSLNTRNTANTQWNGLGITQSSGGFDRYDDMYAIDPTAGSNTTFLGPVQIVARYASDPGNYAQWSPNGGSNFGCVSEPFQDGDTSFNQSSTANQIDSFKMQDLPVTSGSVLAVQTTLVSRTTGVNTVAPLWRISSTDYAGTAVALSSSYQFLSQVYDVSPASSSAWTTSEIAGAELGYKLIS